MTIVCSRCDGNHMRSECPTDPLTRFEVQTTDAREKIRAHLVQMCLASGDGTYIHHNAIEVIDAILSLGVAQAQTGCGEPVAWRYQRNEGWGDIWRAVTVAPTFEAPDEWTVQPLYASANRIVGHTELCLLLLPFLQQGDFTVEALVSAILADFQVIGRTSPVPSADRKAPK